MRGTTIAASTALVLDAEDAADFAMLEQLRADSAIEFIDQSKRDPIWLGVLHWQTSASLETHVWSANNISAR